MDTKESSKTDRHQRTDLIGPIRELAEICVSNRIEHEIIHKDGQCRLEASDLRSAVPLFGGLRRVSDIPVAVRALGNVEEYQFADSDCFNRRAWWGFPEELLKIGVATARQVTRHTRWSKCGEKDGTGGWSAEFAPSGRVFFAVYDCDIAEWCVAKRARKEAIQRAQRLGEILEPARVDQEQGRYVVWLGRKQDLIAGGICDESRFPIGKKRIAYDYCTEPNWHIERVSGEYFEYSVHTPKAETRSAPAKRAPEYESPEAYQLRAESVTNCCVSLIKRMVTNELEKEAYGVKTLSFDKETIRRVCDAAELIEQAVQAGTVGWTRSHKEKIQQAASSSSDATFQAFLADLIRK